MNKLDAGLASCAVAELMITTPKTLTVEARLGQVRDSFDDPHVHMQLLVRDGFLHGTLLRADVSPALSDATTALSLATLTGRTVRPQDRIADIGDSLIRTGQRRLAVVDAQNRLLGLLCLKRDQTGFCEDEDVAARALARSVTTPDRRSC